MSVQSDPYVPIKVMSGDPVRLHLSEILKYEARPMTTRELERRIPGAKGGIDHHLSKLAAAGWIRKESDAGRDSTWISTSDGVRWSDAQVDDPTMQAVVDEMHWMLLQRRITRMRKFDTQRREGAWLGEWVEATLNHDFLIGMTADDLVDFEADIMELINKYRGRDHKDAEGAEAVFISIAAFPWRFDD